MASPQVPSTSRLPAETNFPELCERLKALGYAESKKIRVYGDEFEVVSNPFQQGNGVAVRVRSQRAQQARILAVPLPVLQVATRGKIA